MPANEPNSTQWPIDGTLDLHLFQPKKVGDLVPAYLEECRKRGILQVRGGTGQLREWRMRSCGGLLRRRRSAWHLKMLDWKFEARH